MTRLFLFCLFIVSALIGFAYFTNSERVKITNISTKGNLTVSDKEIIASVRQIISDKYLYIFRGDSAFTIPRKKITSALINAWPSIEKIKVEADDRNALIIEIKERKAAALWCGESEEDFLSEGPAECYYVDKSGYLFSKSPNFSDGVFLKFFGKLMGEEIIDSFLEDSSSFYDRLTFAKSLSELDIDIRKAFYSHDGQFVLRASQNFFILLDSLSPLERIFKNLSAVVRQEILTDDPLYGLSKLEYIDLRFDNKVYYKTIN